MEEYKLELKQVVDYPRCRMYRQFIHGLIANKNVRINGSSGLYYYTVLSCYASFRTENHRVKSITYTVYPGEWICKIEEMIKWFRMRSKQQVIAVMEKLQEKHILKYKIVGHGDVIKYRLSGWAKYNRILEYNAPCQKDIGFFFMPVHIAAELVGSGKNSEMDALIDMWINTVYNDPQVKGSETAPVVYMRNGTGSPLVGYAELAERWGVSKATVGRYMKHLTELDYVNLITYPETHGSVVSLQGYMSTMFQVFDVMVDKEEIAMSLSVRLKAHEIEEKNVSNSVSKSAISVSKLKTEILLAKIISFMFSFGKRMCKGFSCSNCGRLRYMLLELSDCKEGIKRNIKEITEDKKYRLIVTCGGKQALFEFEISLKKCKGGLQDETRE